MKRLRAYRASTMSEIDIIHAGLWIVLLSTLLYCRMYISGGKVEDKQYSVKWKTIECYVPMVIACRPKAATDTRRLQRLTSSHINCVRTSADQVWRMQN